MHRKLRRLLAHHRPPVMLAVRGTLAALAALAVALFLHLECPYWAAMTALIVIQPTRGLLLEKSFYRLVGTAVGSAAGLLMLLYTGSPATLTVLLSLWLAACVGIGNLLYGLRSYGAMVAACTGAIIAMAGYNNPPHLHELVFARIACIVVGIVVSTTVTLFFTQRRTGPELLGLLVKVAAADIAWLALLLRGGGENDLSALRQDMLVEIADIEAALDAVCAGSIGMKKRKRHVRSLIVSLLALLEAGKMAEPRLARLDCDAALWRGPVAGRLEEVAWRLSQKGTIAQVPQLEELTVGTGTHLALLAVTFHELIASLRQLIDQWDRTAQSQERPATSRFIRHRDWREAGRAALRAACAIAAVGSLWYLTGWGEGSSMLMAASIMVSFFSTHDRPFALLTNIFIGASVGVALAFFCRLLLLLQGVACIPVLMAGIVALSHRRLSQGAMDAMLFFLFVMQPGIPAIPATPAYVAGGMAALGGIGVAILAFSLLLPVDPARRLRSILTAIVRDLAGLAAADLAEIEKCRARTQHRVLRMLTNAGKLNMELDSFTEGGLAALAICRWMQSLREIEIKEGFPPETIETIRDTTLRLSEALQRPDEIPVTLAVVSAELAEAMEPYLEAFDCRSTAPATRGAEGFSSATLPAAG